MGKKTPKQPPPPDPVETAAAQGQMNRQTAIAQSQLNQYDEFPPTVLLFIRLLALEQPKAYSVIAEILNLILLNNEF